MRIFTRLLEKLYRVAAKYRCASIVVGAAALTPLSLGISEPALAANECGALDASGSVTCTAAFNPYPTASPTASPRPATPLNVTLNSDVNVTLPAPGIGVALNNFGSGGPVLLSANGATINVTQVPPSSGGNRGLYVETSANNATITASGQIDVAGEGGGNHAIKAFVNGTVGPGNASVTYNGPGLSSSGTNSTVIQAQSDSRKRQHRCFGEHVGSRNQHPIIGKHIRRLVRRRGGDWQCICNLPQRHDQRARKSLQRHLRGSNGNGTAEITTLPGTTIIVSGTNPGDSTPTQTVTAGMSCRITSGTAALGSAITVNAASTINMFGAVTPNASIFGNPVGIRALSKAATDAAPIFVNYTGPGITTEGGGGIGILALARNGGGPGINSGGVTVASSGPITTSGAEALGIVADSGTIYNATRNPPASPGPGGNIMVTASGAITTQGAEAHGIWAASTTGTVQVNAIQ